LDLEQLKRIAITLGYTKFFHHKIFICGNGGSASAASHMVDDLELQCDLNVTCLSDNIPTLTALANDIGYENVFAQQLHRQASSMDYLIVISGSGNSKNILEAIKMAKDMDVNVIAIIGMDGGKVKKIKGIECIHIPTDMFHFEDISIVLDHYLCSLIKLEYELYKSKNGNL